MASSTSPLPRKYPSDDVEDALVTLMCTMRRTPAVTAAPMSAREFSTARSKVISPRAKRIQ